MTNPINPYDYDRARQNLAGFTAALILALLFGCALVSLVLP